jgi:hypothetical protein
MKTPTLTQLRRLAAQHWGVDARTAVGVYISRGTGSRGAWLAQAWTDVRRFIYVTGTTERAALLALAREFRR